MDTGRRVAEFDIGVYKVVQWTSTEHAVVDMASFMKYRNEDADASMIAKSTDIDSMKDLASKLNARFKEALETKLHTPNTVELDDESTHMLNRITEGLTVQLAKTMEEHPILNILRKAVKESNDPKAHEALAHTEAEAEKYISVTNTDMLQKLIRKAYASGVEQGAVKP